MAVTLDADALLVELGADRSRLLMVSRLLGLASARVTRYAPGAPDDVADEAVVLLAAFLYQSGAQARTILPADGEGRILNISMAFRSSGAQGLLSSWRKPRVGACVS